MHSPPPPSDPALLRDWANGSRFDPHDKRGFYESWFLRANHPSRPLAFWIRYTVFVPKGRPGEAMGELWAIYFDREGGRIVTAKEVAPMARCSLANAGLDVTIDGRILDHERLEGSARHAGHAVSWDLRYTTPSLPLLNYPAGLYPGGFPKAKALVSSPNAVFDGTLGVDGDEIVIDGWVGSQNHNWGLQHTDTYAWGQVCGFDNEPDTFLECGTGKLKFGPLWTPWLSVIVLRDGDREHRFNGVRQWMRNGGSFGWYRLELDGRQDGVRIRGTIEAKREDFVGLPYWNPPGGIRTCLNSKLARAEFVIEEPGKEPRHLVSEHRAALELVPTTNDHGITLMELPAPTP
jgi:hypothetical protein